MRHDGMDFYQVLNVPRTAAAEEIKQAYHRAARRYHPDKKHQPVTIATPPAGGEAQGGDARRGVAVDPHAGSETTPDDHHQPPHQQQPQSSWAFLRIQEAWECLGDTAKRLDYDRRLRQEQDAMGRRMRNAIVLTSADCRWEQQAATAAGDDEDVHHDNHVFYQCRCGYDLALTMLPALQDDLIACPGCSLIYDTAPLFR